MRDADNQYVLTNVQDATVSDLDSVDIWINWNNDGSARYQNESGAVASGYTVGRHNDIVTSYPTSITDVTTETVEVLATRGRTLLAAVWMFVWTQSNFVILDGRVVRANRIRAHNCAYYSSKHKYDGVTCRD